MLTKYDLMLLLKDIPDDQEICVLYRFADQDSPMKWVGITDDGELVVTEE
jgi:hypothetical protein